MASLFFSSFLVPVYVPSSQASLIGRAGVEHALNHAATRQPAPSSAAAPDALAPRETSPEAPLVLDGLHECVHQDRHAGLDHRIGGRRKRLKHRNWVMATRWPVGNVDESGPGEMARHQKLQQFQTALWRPSVDSGAYTGVEAGI